MTRVISDVPTKKLFLVVQDLAFEVSRENITVKLQPNDLWRVEYTVD